MRVCNVFIEKEEDKELIMKGLFRSAEWLELDRGAISEEAAMVSVKERLPQQYQKDLAQKCMDHWDDYNMSPKEGMQELVEKLKEKGYRIYLLSNASHRLRNYQDMIPGIDLFDGMIVSAEELCIKPEPKIYQVLFERYGLNPEECFFIDDLQENIEGARECGMDGYCFADGDVAKLREKLMSL